MSRVAYQAAPWSGAALVFASTLSGTVLIPVLRPLVSTIHGGSDAAIHAFVAAHMLGAILAAPLLALRADRSGRRRGLAATLAFADAMLLLACALPLPLPAIYVLRLFQGAASVGTLSIVMGQAGQHGRGAIGLAGSALVLAIAVGAPLGTAVLRWSAITPVVLSALLSIAVAIGVLATFPSRGAVSPPRTGLRMLAATTPGLRIPLAWAAVERFTVGCFVVTFALHAHRGLGLSDGQVGSLFAYFLVPFALASWPAARLAGRVDRRALLIGGAVLYGLTFVALGGATREQLPLVLALAGIASAAIYSPCLCLALGLVPAAQRSTSMGLLNAAGTLGMFLGTASAGSAIEVLTRLGIDRLEAYRAVLWGAGVVVFLALAASVRAILDLTPDEAAPQAQVLS